MDIEAWLQGLGLERYVPAFRDNKIDEGVLPKLASEDLREIGIAPIGHRRKLLDATAPLGASEPAAAVKAAVSDASAPADGERHTMSASGAPVPSRFERGAKILADLASIIVPFAILFIGVYYTNMQHQKDLESRNVTILIQDGPLLLSNDPAHESNME